jgi:ribokinase
MRILNYGSINVDQVYRVDHISAPGETLAAQSYELFAGGKGANQSAALARAGAHTYHAGRVGAQGAWVVDKLAGLGVDTRFIAVCDEPTGHAIIQVDRHGQNSIVIFPGANRSQQPGAMEAALSHFAAGDILLLQNEINGVHELMEKGSEAGLRVVYNPAPMTAEVAWLPLHLLDTIVLNQTEAAQLTGTRKPEDQLVAVSTRWPGPDCVLTLGERGVAYRGRAGSFALPARSLEPLDTTGAGDTFVGYYLAGIAAGVPPKAAAERAIRASSLCIMRSGAMNSIPNSIEVDSA